MLKTIKTFLMIGLLSGASIVAYAQAGDDAANPVESAVIDEQAQPPVNPNVVYKSIGKDGQVIFTDKMPTDRPSTPVEVKQANRVPPPSARGDSAEQNNEKVSNKYDRLVVTSPANDDYFDQEAAMVNLSAMSEPDVREQHIAQLYYDGQPVPEQGFSYSVFDMERGTHTVVAKILDKSGRVLIESEPVKFHVRRTSILNQHKSMPINGNNTSATPPPPSGFGGAKGFGGMGGAGSGASAGGAGGAGGLGGAAPTPAPAPKAKPVAP